MNKPKYKPIPFTAPMVRAILEGRKTQTRRIVKSNFDVIGERVDGSLWPWRETDDAQDYWYPCPYGQPGDRLWVKETYKFNPGGPIYDASGGCMDSMDDELIYRADRSNLKTKWTSSRFMPRWASRITLEVTGVRVERLQDVSEEDCFSEGVQRLENHSWDAKGSKPLGTYKGLDEWTDKVNYWVDPRDAYKAMWNSIHGHGAWDKNPWVWVVEFKKVEEK